MPIAPLPDRGLVEVSGPDRARFLQGLVSNDVSALGTAADGSADAPMVWAALLSPQGKWISDFLAFEAPSLAPGAILLDLPRADAPLVVERLSRFRLRSQVALADRSGTVAVSALWGGEAPPPGATARRDPRLEAAGWRLYRDVAEGTPARDDEMGGDVAEGAPAAGDPAAYERHRLALGLPDGARDLDRDRTVLLEAGFDELHGIAWEKGCYMGQELTARTRYRGLLKRRLVPVAVDGPLPPRDAPVTRDGAVVGEMRSGLGDRGLALLRIDALGTDPQRGAALECAGAVLRPDLPGWMRLPAA